MNVLGLIPARSGSKTVPDKNIREVAGRPLMAWSIEHALKSQKISRTIVSTDSEAYAEIARTYGAEIPFLRPPEISGDEATDLEVFDHALRWLEEHEGSVPDICVHLRPTCPVRSVEMIDVMIDLLVEHPEYDSVRSIAPTTHPPYKMWLRDRYGVLSPVVTLDGIKEPWNAPRQRLPETFVQTANVDVVRSRVVLEQKSMTGKTIYGYLESEMIDIDTEAELRRATRALERSLAAATGPSRQEGSREEGSKTFCFDIDGVIATSTDTMDYGKSGPRRKMINTVNRLYEAGHRIVLFTARGTMTGIDWRETTEAQMKRWGVKYHELQFGKPAADYYIDDRMIDMHEIDDMEF